MGRTKFIKGYKTGLGLEVISHIITGNKITHFKCRCLHCGGETIILRSHIFKTKSCGCLKSRSGKNNPRFTGCGGIHGGKWSSYKRNATKRNIPFTITIEEAWDIFLSQKGKCAITGINISLWKTAKSIDRTATASLDRIDNNKGYEKNNIHWVHKRINQIKMDMELNEFYDWCLKVVNNANIK